MQKQPTAGSRNLEPNRDAQGEDGRTDAHKSGNKTLKRRTTHRSGTNKLYQVCQRIAKNPTTIGEENVNIYCNYDNPFSIYTYEEGQGKT